MVISFEKTELLHCFQDIAEKWKLLDLPPSRLLRLGRRHGFRHSSPTKWFNKELDIIVKIHVNLSWSVLKRVEVLEKHY